MKKYHSFFENMTRDSAYILGLWWADGCIYEKGYKHIFDLAQNIKDQYLIHRIANMMGYDGKLYESNGVIRLQIQSKDIVQFIKNIGGSQCKSKDKVFPFIDKKYLPDFIRGNFDGDGSIFREKSRLNRYRSQFCSGSKRFLEEVHKILKENKSDTGGYIKHYSKFRFNVDTEWYVLRFGYADTFYLKQYMYHECTNDSLFLDRKKLIFDEVKEVMKRSHNPTI